MADDAVIKYSDLIGKDDTFVVLSKQIEILKKELLELAAVTKKEIKLTNPNDAAQIEAVQKKVTELKIAKENLNKIEKVAIVTKKAQIQQTAEELVQIETEKIKRREQIALAKQQAILQRSEKGSIAALRAELALVTIEWKKLTAAETTDLQTGRALTAQKLALTQQLKKLEKATGDHRREVGNYTLAGNKTVSMLSRMNIAGNKLTGVFGRAGRALDSVGFGAFALAAAAATIAWQFFSDTFLTNSDDIIEKNKELKESINDLTTSISTTVRDNKFLQIETSNLSDAEKRLAKIKLLEADLGKFRSQLGDANKAATESQSRVDTAIFKTELEKNAAIEKNLKITQDYLTLSGEIKKTEQEISNINKEGVKASQDANKARKEALQKELDNKKKLEGEIGKLQSDRLKAIEEIQRQITEVEAENISNRQEKLLFLEELKLKEENRIREENFIKVVDLIEEQEVKIIELYGKNSKEVLAFRTETDTALLNLESNNEKLSEEQLRASEKRKLEIRKEFAISTTEIEALTQESIEAREKAKADAFNKSVGIDVEELKRNQEEINAFEAKQREDKIAKTKAANQQIVDDVAASAQKVAEILNGIFAKQAELSAENVTKQEDNLARARERAEQGLTANIAFEEAELAKRQAENIKRQKEAANAAKLLSLFSLVSAYAQNGDKNALFRGLADFAILEAIGAALPQFYEGTEDTGTVSNPLDNKGGRRAILHDNERVVPKKLNAFLDGMSNEDLVSNALIGSHVSDNFPPQSITKQNLFEGQKNAFTRGQSSANSDTSTLMLRELSRLNERLSKQPNIGIEIEKVYTNVYDIVKSEVKAGMIKVSKKRL